MGDDRLEKARVSFRVGAVQQGQAATVPAAPATQPSTQPLDQPATEVEATFTIGEQFQGLQPQWSAVPLDDTLPLDAWAPSGGAQTMSGFFLPGRYRVTGDAGDMQFAGDVEITAEGPNMFEIGLAPEPGSDPGGPLTEEGAAALLDRLVPDRKPAE